MHPVLLRRVLTIQTNEITEQIVYEHLAESEKDASNKKILERIAADEKQHHQIWQKITGQKTAPTRWKILFYVFLSKFLGLSFSLKMMEKSEEIAQEMYAQLDKDYPEALEILRDEKRHKNDLLNLINGKYLQYVSSGVAAINFDIG